MSAACVLVFIQSPFKTFVSFCTLSTSLFSSFLNAICTHFIFLWETVEGLVCESRRVGLLLLQVKLWLVVKIEVDDMWFGVLPVLPHRESDKDGSAEDKTPPAAVRGLLI